MRYARTESLWKLALPTAKHANLRVFLSCHQNDSVKR